MTDQGTLTNGVGVAKLVFPKILSNPLFSCVTVYVIKT